MPPSEEKSHTPTIQYIPVRLIPVEKMNVRVTLDTSIMLHFIEYRARQSYSFDRFYFSTSWWQGETGRVDDVIGRELHLRRCPVINFDRVF